MMRRRTNPGRLRAAVIKAERSRRGKGAAPVVRFESDRWTRRVIRPLLVAAMGTALAAGLLVVIDIASPGPAWFALLPLCFLLALEGAYTAAWMGNPESRGVDKGVYRAAELLVILIVARLYSWVALGGGVPTIEDLQLYLRSPLEFFFRSGFFTTVVVVLATWMFSSVVNRLFNQLDVSPGEVDFYTLPVAEQKAQADNQPISTSRLSLQNQYMQVWLGGGMALVIMAALSTYQVGEFVTEASPLDITRLGLRPLMLIALLVYFLTGFWLLGQARLLRLNARWLVDGMGKEAALERDWRRASLIIVTLVAAAAAFIPIGSSPAISQILAAGLNAILWVIGAAFSLLNFFFLSILAFFARSGETQPPTEMEPFLPPPPVTPPPASPPPNDTLMFFFSSAFWTFLIVVTFAALLFLIRERGVRFRWDSVQGGAASVRGWLIGIWLRLTNRFRQVSLTLRQALTREPAESAPGPPAPTAPPRFLRVSGMSPRDQIRYYYLSLVRRANDVGIRRQNSETPLEYLDDLRETWPEASDDLEQLTDAFLEARYSARPVVQEEARSLRERWKRARAALHQRKNNNIRQ